MENSENKEIITTWDNTNFSTKEIGDIFITDDGHVLYGKVNKSFQDYKYPIGHGDIFEACVKELGVHLPIGLDQMGYAWALASDDINIISLQVIPPKDIIVVMNKNSTNQQLSLLNAITSYFNKYHYLFTADVCFGEEVKSICDSSNTNHEYGLELNDFNEQLKIILSDLENSNGSKK